MRGLRLCYATLPASDLTNSEAVSVCGAVDLMADEGDLVPSVRLAPEFAADEAHLEPDGHDEQLRVPREGDSMAPVQTYRVRELLQFAVITASFRRLAVSVPWAGISGPTRVL